MPIFYRGFIGNHEDDQTAVLARGCHIPKLGNYSTHFFDELHESCTKSKCTQEVFFFCSCFRIMSHYAPQPQPGLDRGRGGAWERLINHPSENSVTPPVYDRWLPDEDCAERSRTSLKHQHLSPHQPVCAPALWCTHVAPSTAADKNPKRVNQVIYTRTHVTLTPLQHHGVCQRNVLGAQ